MRRDTRLRKEANAAKYEPVAAVPEGLTWKNLPGFAVSKTTTTLFSIGNIYKLIRDRATGDVAYFKLRDAENGKSSAESIDAEPEPPKQQRFRVGSHAWFVVDAAHWYAVVIVTRGTSTDGRMSIRSVTGWDAERRAAWPFGDVLEFPDRTNNPMFQRLRKLSARQR